MILSLNYQAWLFLSTILAGVVMGITYDMVRILRIAVKHPKFLIQVEDGIYWIFVIFAMFFFMLHENYGEIRFFSILGAFLGMLVYFLTISKAIMGISSFIINFIKYIFFLLLRILFTPFRLLFKLFCIPARRTSKFFSKKYKNVLHLMKLYAKIKLKRFNVKNKIINNKKKAKKVGVKK